MYYRHGRLKDYVVLGGGNNYKNRNATTNQSHGQIVRSNSEVGVIGHGNSVLTSQKLPKFPPPTPIYDSETKNKKQTKQRKTSYLAFYKVAKYQC